MAYSGFPRARGGGGRQPIIWPIFPENCMKMKKFLGQRGGRTSLRPLDPPMKGFTFHQN